MMSDELCRSIGGASARALPPTNWKSLSTLESVHQLNHHFLGVLAGLASSDAGLTSLEIVSSHRELWSKLEPCSLKRAALNPVLLLQVHFNNDDWWKWVIRRPRGSWKGVRTENRFSPKIALELMRATLMLAWSGARESHSSVGVLFGMSTRVAHTISVLTPQEIELIASRHSRELRPRWEDMPTFWRLLLAAACGADDVKLREVHLYSHQLIASELHGGAS
jgi:hypothetical protein